MHFLDEAVDLADGFRVVLQRLAKLVEFLDVLLDVALEVARNGRCVGPYRLRQFRIVAGVDFAVVAIAAAVASADGGAEASTRTPGIRYASGLIICTTISLTSSISLTGLTRLAVLSLLASLTVGPARIHGLQLVAKALDAIKNGVGILRLAAAQGLLGLAYLVAELLQAGGDFLLD